MDNITGIQNELVGKFPFLQDKTRTLRSRRISADVEPQNFRAVFDYAIDRLGFVILCTITGLDEADRFGVIYHIAKEDGAILNLKTYALKTDPTIKTVTDRFSAADIYERELMDLLGIKVEGLAPGRRYPLADDWPTDQYPLRKDWKPNKETTI